MYPMLSSSSIPTLPSLGLSDDEQKTLVALQDEAMRCRSDIELEQAYYLGNFVIQNLRIAVPKELEFLRTIVGWPAIGVDPLVERLSADGFRLAGATDADSRLMELWDANGLAAEQSLAFTDALAMRRAYWAVGSPLEAGGAPQITVESPLNMTVLWDLRGLNARASLQEYWDAGRRHAVLQMPGKAITLATDDRGTWVLVDRDDHGMPFVPVVRMANRPRTNNRDGASEITPIVRSLTDAACRTLLNLEVAREIYSVPKQALLGAAESSFQNTDGTPKSAWQTYITHVLALERDEEGNLPDIKQLQAYDPSVFTKLIDMYASQVAGHVAANPQDLGLYTEGNPTSAEAAEIIESRRNRRAEIRQATFGVPMVKAMQYGLRFENKGVLPKEFERISTDWRPVAQAPLVAASDAISKQVAAGSVPPTSDVVLKRLGYSAVERMRLEQDRKRDEGRQALNAIAESLAAPQVTEQAAPDGDTAGV